MNRVLLTSCALLVSSVAPGCGGDDGKATGSSNNGGGGSGGTGAASGGGGTGGLATGGYGGNAASGATGGAAGNASGGNGGDAGASGSAGSGGSAGGANKTCEMLNDDYVAAVAAAKKCAYGTSPNPCTTKLKGALECQCPTYVNPANAAALAEMTALEGAWVAQGCVSIACPCSNPTGGACYAGPGGPSDGLCSDS